MQSAVGFADGQMNDFTFPHFTTKLETNLKHFVKTRSRVFRTSDWVESSPSNQTMTLNSQPSQHEGGLERC